MDRRYIVFVYDSRQPKGGWQDVVHSDDGLTAEFFETFQDAATAGNEHWKRRYPEHGRFQVVDVVTGRFVGSGGFSQ